MMKKVYFCFIVILLFLSGCAKNIPITPPTSKGIYHRVEAGQTLWRISKAYGVDVERIVKANHLPNSSSISSGQLLFIPQATAEKDIAAPSSKNKTGKQNFIWPLEGKVISSYGAQVNGTTSKGINISGKEGAIVKASGSGKVSFVDKKVKGKGEVLIIDHLNGYLTLYAHNSDILVEPGEKVTQGQAIAKVGKTGRVQEPQLYFEIRKGHSAQNPFHYLP